RQTTSTAVRAATSRRSAERITSAMSEPMLPFDDETDRPKADPTSAERAGARAGATSPEMVRLNSGAGRKVRGSDVRRGPAVGSVRLPSSHEASADRRSLGEGGQPDRDQPEDR